MAVYDVGLLLITKALCGCTAILPDLLINAQKYIKSKLYVALESSALRNARPVCALYFLYGVYRTCNETCQHLDVRVLLQNFKNWQSVDQIRSTALSADCLLTDCDAQTLTRLLPFISDVTNLIELARSNGRADGAVACGCQNIFTSVDGSATSPVVGAYKDVVIGGTFDRLHNGHKIVLSVAALLSAGSVTCGVTGPGMISKKLLHELITPTQQRIDGVSKFLHEVDPSLQTDVVVIEDAFGPSVVKADIDCIVATRETAAGAFAVNEKRCKDNHLNRLDVFIFDLIEGSRAGKIGSRALSSTEHRFQLLGTLLKPPKTTRLYDKVYVIGLTGGVASGKSHVAKYMQSLGATVIDCDKLGHQAYLPGTDAYDKVVRSFGSEVVDKDNGQVISRQRLGQIVFSNRDSLHLLNSIVWPCIRQLIEKAIADFQRKLIMVGDKETKIIVVDAAILIEAGWHSLVDEIWETFVPREEAIRRIMERNQKTREQAEKQIDSQMSVEERMVYANVVFCSLWDYPITRAQVDKAWRDLHARLDSVDNN